MAARPARPRRTSGLRAFALLVALLAVALPSVLGGARYVWCEGMSRAMLHACCPEEHPDPAHAAIDQPCCEDRFVSAMPATSLGHGVDGLVAPPAVLFFAMAVWLLAMRRRAPALAVPRGRTLARAGPEPPLFLVHCALLN